MSEKLVSIKKVGGGSGGSGFKTCTIVGTISNTVGVQRQNNSTQALNVNMRSLLVRCKDISRVYSINSSTTPYVSYLDENGIQKETFYMTQNSNFAVNKNYKYMTISGVSINNGSIYFAL